MGRNASHQTVVRDDKGHGLAVLATATSQRWEPAEVLRVLLAEEAAGRDQATIQMRRRQSGLPAGKTFDASSASLGSTQARCASHSSAATARQRTSHKQAGPPPTIGNAAARS